VFASLDNALFSLNILSLAKRDRLEHLFIFRIFLLAGGKLLELLQRISAWKDEDKRRARTRVIIRLLNVKDWW
jgi:hypothetical protein